MPFYIKTLCAVATLALLFASSAFAASLDQQIGFDRQTGLDGQNSATVKVGNHQAGVAGNANAARRDDGLIGIKSLGANAVHGVEITNGAIVKSTKFAAKDAGEKTEAAGDETIQAAQTSTEHAVTVNRNPASVTIEASKHIEASKQTEATVANKAGTEKP